MEFFCFVNNILHRQIYTCKHVCVSLSLSEVCLSPAHKCFTPFPLTSLYLILLVNRLSLVRAHFFPLTHTFLAFTSFIFVCRVSIFVLIDVWIRWPLQPSYFLWLNYEQLFNNQRWFFIFNKEWSLIRNGQIGSRCLQIS